MVEGKMLSSKEEHNPCDDVLFLEDELNKWFYNILTKVWRSFARRTEVSDVSFSEAVTKQFSGLKVSEDQVKRVLLKLGFAEKPSQWSDEQIMKLLAEHEKKQTAKSKAA